MPVRPLQSKETIPRTFRIMVRVFLGTFKPE
jgi:hypothetical protein